jgi:flagellar hook-associated protein 2
VAGTYSVEVTALATNQRLALGKTYAAGDPVLDFGSDSTRTDRHQEWHPGGHHPGKRSKHPCRGRDAINKAEAGVNATIVTDTSGKQNLLLTATTGGTAAAVSLSGTATFIDPGAPGSPIASSAFTQTQAATDAAVKIQGVSIATKGNTITDAVDGITLQLTKTGSTSLTVTRDNSDLKTKVEASSALTTPELLGEESRCLRQHQDRRCAQRRCVPAHHPVPGPGCRHQHARQPRNQRGQDPGRHGCLLPDRWQSEARQHQVRQGRQQQFYGGGHGTRRLRRRIKTTTTNLLGTGGVIASRTDGLNSSIKNLDKRIEALNTRLTMIEKTYRAQFTALDTTMTSMSTTSSYLSQQLSILSNMASN